MSLWATALLHIGATLLGSLLRPKADRTPPTARDREFTLPTVEPGRAIPIVWGAVHIKDPAVLWWGRLEAVRQTGTGLYTNVDVDVDHWRVTLMIGICHGPVEQSFTIYWNDRPVTPDEIELYSEPSHPYVRIKKQRFFELTPREYILQAYFQNPNYYDGFAELYYFRVGNDVQTPDVLLQFPEFIGAPLPPYKGLCYIVMGGVHLGPSLTGAPPLQALSFDVARRPNQLGLPSGHHIVNLQDANPACMIFELLTDPRWGCGLPTTAIDVAGFQAAGETLYAEGTGLSMVVSDQQPSREIADEILRHIDGVLFTDPATGLLTLKLVRGDYDFDSLPVIDGSMVRNVEFSRPGWAETKNMVRVRYRGPLGSERVATETNLAAVQIRGPLVVEDLTFHGIFDPAQAQRTAARELKTVSYPFARAGFEVNRRAWALHPASPFRFTYAPYGIEDLVMRVTSMGSGTLDDGWIRIEAVEDAFAVNWTGMTPATETEWQDPLQVPVAPDAAHLEEVPYPQAGGANRRVHAMVRRGPGLMTGHEVWTDPAGGEAYALTARGGFAAAAVLRGTMGFKATSFTIEDAADAGLLQGITAAELANGVNLCLIGDEWMAWQTITDHGDGTLTISGVKRGVIDTTPRIHRSGARVWFPTEGALLTRQADYASDITLAARFRAFNAAGVTALASSPRRTLETRSRATRPYLPTAVLINGAAYPKTRSGELTVSWSHRNRLGTWSYADSGATASPETDTTYRLKIYGDGGGYGKDYGNSYGGFGKLKRTYSGITGTSQTYPQATEEADNGGSLNAFLRIVLEALVSGLGSHKLYDYTVGASAGYGFDYGNDYGT